MFAGLTEGDNGAANIPSSDTRAPGHNTLAESSGGVFTFYVLSP